MFKVCEFFEHKQLKYLKDNIIHIWIFKKMSNLNNVIAWSLVLKTIIFKEILLHRLLIFLLNYYSKYKLIFLLSNFLIFGFAFPTFRSLYSPGSLRCLVFGNLLGMLNEIQIRNTTDTWGRLESTAVETSWKKKKNLLENIAVQS